MKSSLIRKIVIATFLSVPAISSVISTIHLIDLFNLGNPTWLSMLLAVTFELGSIASLLAISVIERIKVGAIWFIFFILSGLQIIGNVYYSYSFTSDQLLSNPIFLTNFMDLFSFITGDEIRDVKIFLSCIIGIPIPLIALFFLKSNIDYLKPTSEKKEDVRIETDNQPQQIERVNEPGPIAENVSNPIVEDPQQGQSPNDALTRLAQDLGMYDEPHEMIDQQETVETENQVNDEEYDDHQDEIYIRRNRRPMISERRSDPVSVLHRG